jgi:hypothetical protein
VLPTLLLLVLTAQVLAATPINQPGGSIKSLPSLSQAGHKGAARKLAAVDSAAAVTRSDFFIPRIPTFKTTVLPRDTALLFPRLPPAEMPQSPRAGPAGMSPVRTAPTKTPTKSPQGPNPTGSAAAASSRSSDSTYRATALFRAALCTTHGASATSCAKPLTRACCSGSICYGPAPTGKECKSIATTACCPTSAITKLMLDSVYRPQSLVPRGVEPPHPHSFPPPTPGELLGW